MNFASDVIVFSASPEIYQKLDYVIAMLQYRPPMFLLFVHQIVMSVKEVLCTKDTLRM